MERYAMKWFAFLLGSLLMLPHLAWGQYTGNLPPGAVLNNAALKTRTGMISVVRLGFTTAGDGGRATYNWSTSNCTAADDGAQVQPTGMTGCWIADFSDTQPTPMIWGAKGNGTTNDTVAVQKAITAMAGSTLYIGEHKYCIGAPGLITYRPITIQGGTTGYPWDNTHPNYGFVACATNINMLSFITDGPNVASGSRISGVYFDAGKAGVNSSGTAITMSQTSFMKIDHVAIHKACIGIDDRMSNNTTIEHVLITSGGQASAQLPAGCGGVRVGADSTGAALTSLKLNSVTSDVKGDYGLLIMSSGGLFINQSDFLFAKNGTIIRPGANQSVTWLFANSSSLGDTTCASGLLIDTGAASAVVTGLSFVGTWTSSAGKGLDGCLGDGVQIMNTGGGVVRGIHFNAHRSYNNGKTGFVIEPNVFDVSIDASMICNNAMEKSIHPTVNHAGVTLGLGVAGVAIRGNRISPSCAYTGLLTLQHVGMYLVGGHYGLTIVGNDLHDSNSPIEGIPPAGINTIISNSVVDSFIDDRPAAPTVAAGFAPQLALTGASATVTNVTGLWANREIHIHARDAAQTFAVGTGSGAVCNAKTLPKGGYMKAISFSGGGACVYLFNP